MPRSATIPPRDQVGPDTPLRLDVAAALAYPDGSMTASGLRKEAARGRLVLERTAGKDYTTLAAIAEMRVQCRRAAKDQGFGSDVPAETASSAPSLVPLSGSSKTPAERSIALDAALMIAEGLRKRSRTSSGASTSTKRRKGNVIHLKSRSRTS